MSFDEAAYKREICNIGGKPLINPAFKREWLDAVENTLYRLDRDCFHIFVTIDPSGGSDRSLYVIMSSVFTADGLCVVCSYFSLVILLFTCEGCRHGMFECPADENR